jgi:hypothetical protein
VATFDWYDDTVHLWAHEQFMKAPEFLTLPPVIQAQFAMHREAHLIRVQQQMAAQLALQNASAGDSDDAGSESPEPASAAPAAPAANEAAA